MSFILTTCPHCAANKTALEIIHATGGTGGAHFANVWLYCRNCGEPTAGVLNNETRGFDLRNFEISQNNIANHGWRIRALYPAMPEPRIPTHTPEKTQRALLQAEDNFTRRGNETAAAIMYRKALETAIKTIEPDGKGTLYKRIETLVTAGRITAELGKWAHEIRGIGNDAAHELDDVSRDELEDLRNFTDLFLRYLFMLPGMLEERRAPAMDAPVADDE